MHLAGHRLAFLRRADQLGPHRFDLLGRGFIIAHHGFGREPAYTRYPFAMLDIVWHRFRRKRSRSPDGQCGQSRRDASSKPVQIWLVSRNLLDVCHESNLLLVTTPDEMEPMGKKFRTIVARPDHP